VNSSCKTHLLKMLVALKCKFFETRVIGNFKVWVLQCFEWVDLGTLIMLGCHLLCPIFGKICWKICGLSSVGKRIQLIPSKTMMAY